MGKNKINGSRQVITIATGKQLYLDMAVNLARSFFYWHTHSDIIFQIVTDNPGNLPRDIKQRCQIIAIEPGQFGVGFSTKLNLDQLISHGQTLFIDSDCLIFESLDTLFERFKGHNVSAVGNYISGGEWFGDIEQVCRQFNVPCLPKFNGGLYYIERGAKATRVYQTARQLEKQYDEIGFVRLRGQPNDEVLMALAMQLNEETPVVDDGTVMSDPQACPGGYYINIFAGKRWLINPPKAHKRHQAWYPFRKVSPAIFHFLGSYTDHYPYRREAYKLRMFFLEKKPMFLAYTMAFILIQLPKQLGNGMKNIFRPVYHLFFGFRKIKRSERLQ